MELRAIGLTESSIRWFSFYLSDRCQLVELGDILSSSANVTCGVPLGSILGSLIFLIYVNDLAVVVKNKLLLYLDDSAILVSAKNKYDIENLLIHDLNIVSQWLIGNKLSLHLGKTESIFILFGSNKRLKSQSNLDIVCDGQSIKSKDSVEYLGATTDQNLFFKSMASSVIKKANARLKYLYRKSEFVTPHTKKLLVTSLIQCHFDYASAAWFYGLSQELKNKLQITQNKLIRFVLNLNPRSHISSEHFSNVEWLPVESRVNQITLCHVF